MVKQQHNNNEESGNRNWYVTQALSVFSMSVGTDDFKVIFKKKKKTALYIPDYRIQGK